MEVVKPLRLIAAGVISSTLIALAGCAPASEAHFETLGNAICVNTASAIASQAQLIVDGKAEGDDASLVSLAMIKAHRAEATAFEGLTPPAHLESSWEAIIDYVNTASDLAGDRLSGRDLEAGLLHSDHQDQFHLSMSAIGLDECATRGDEWPGQSSPVGTGRVDPAAFGTPPAGTKLLPGVIVDGFQTAPDPAEGIGGGAGANDLMP